MPTPAEVENTKFHRFSLDKPQDKHRPLKHKVSLSNPQIKLGHSIDTTSQNSYDLVSYAISKAQKGEHAIKHLRDL
jgi:hypothetical protein